MSRRDGQAGFSLLEVIVAFAIAAAAIVVLLRTFGLGLRSGEAADWHMRALLIAQSRLDAVVAGDRTPDGRDGLAWQIRLEPRGEPAGALRLTAIEVLVQPPEGTGAPYRLYSERLLPEAGQ